MADQTSTPISSDDASRVDSDRGSSFASEMERDKAHREKARSAKPLRRLLPFVLAYPGLLAAFSVFLFLASALTLLLPAAFRLVVDCGFGGAMQSQSCTQFALGTNLSAYFVGGIIVAVLLGLVSALRYYFISRLGERVVADLRRAVYDHLLGLSPSFYAKTQTGEVLSRLTTDTTLIQTVVGSSISIALRTIATTLGALVLMVIVSWKLALMVLMVGPVIIGPILLFGSRVQRLSRSGQDSLAAASGRASESLRAIETVQAFTREPEERANFGRAVEQTFDVALRRIKVSAFMTAVVFSFILAGLIAVLWYGAVQVKAEAITPGAMTQFVMYAFVAVSGVGMLTETYAEVMRAAGATERLMEILAATPDVDAPEHPITLPTPVAGRIVFKNVDFAYPARPDAAALRGVSLSIEPGQTVALVGPSGAGKSTMFQLLLRLYDPQGGSISVDGIDIRQLDPSALREALSIVQRGLSRSPDDQALLGVKAGILVMLGRTPEAVETYQRVLELSPKDDAVRVRYAREYRDNPDDLKNVLITTPSGVQVPLQELEDIADIEIGEALRRTRLHYCRSLEDIEKSLRIRASQIDAIERGDIASLPG
ncbi:MAG: ATP-binding cassette domain-containing protein, partial [Henriciella sp.]|nr:ATP-binding cassette domain-containing protein [Henriciella sp.]